VIDGIGTHCEETFAGSSATLHFIFASFERARRPVYLMELISRHPIARGVTGRVMVTAIRGVIVRSL
jgi:hypothetical protein